MTKYILRFSYLNGDFFLPLIFQLRRGIGKYTWDKENILVIIIFYWLFSFQFLDPSKY